MQKIASKRQNNICIPYCSYIRYIILNKLLFSPVQSLDHVLPKYLLGGVLYTMIFYNHIIRATKYCMLALYGLGNYPAIAEFSMLL